MRDGSMLGLYLKVERGVRAPFGGIPSHLRWQIICDIRGMESFIPLGLENRDQPLPWSFMKCRSTCFLEWLLNHQRLLEDSCTSLPSSVLLNSDDGAGKERPRKARIIQSLHGLTLHMFPFLQNILYFCLISWGWWRAFLKHLTA